MEFVLALITFIVVLTGGMYGFSVLASKWVTRAIQNRLRTLQDIIEGEIPDLWLHPFRRRVLALRRNAASEAQFTRLGKRIQKRCLRNLDEMTRYVANVNMTDGEVTHKEIATLLQEHRQTWPAKDWRAWIAAVEALDTPRASDEDQADFSSRLPD